MDLPDEPVAVEAARDEVAEEVVVEAPPWSPQDTAAQVSVIAVDDTLPPSADVATAVQRAPGTVVRRLGGLGSWSSVSIRGSTARQVEVFLDGLPLNPEGGGAANLSELPLQAFEAVHVYRGTAPLHLDSSAVGGAVDLVTGDARGSRAAVAYGSWTTGRVSAAHAGAMGSPGSDVLVALEGLSTHGDFPWFDDAGTRTEASDDRWVRRGNNGTEQLALHARWRGGTDRARLTLFDGWVHREEGVPGPIVAPWSAVAYEVDRHLPTAQLDVQGPEGTDGQLRTWGLVRQETLADPLGELLGTTAAVTTVRTASVGVRAQGRALLGPLRLATMASARDDRLDGASARTVARAGGEAVLARGPWRGAITLRALGTEGALRWIPRVGGRVALGSGPVEAWLKASGGRSVRLPDLTELYGDRGALVGNPDLRDERGSTADASVGVEAAGVRAEVGGFHQVVDDRIVWTRNAQGVALPVNLDTTRSTGAELAAHWSPGPLRLDSTGTLTRAEDRSAGVPPGRQLPGIPWVEWFHRTGLELRRVRLAHDLSVTAGTFADPANWDLQAPRWLHGLTAEVHDRDDVWGLSLDVRNLLDQRTQQVPRDPLVGDGVLVPEPLVDFTGYPLPGRTWMAQLRWRR